MRRRGCVILFSSRFLPGRGRLGTRVPRLRTLHPRRGLPRRRSLPPQLTPSPDLRLHLLRTNRRCPRERNRLMTRATLHTHRITRCPSKHPLRMPVSPRTKRPLERRRCRRERRIGHGAPVVILRKDLPLLGVLLAYHGLVHVGWSLPIAVDVGVVVIGGLGYVRATEDVVERVGIRRSDGCDGAEWWMEVPAVPVIVCAIDERRWRGRRALAMRSRWDGCIRTRGLNITLEIDRRIVWIVMQIIYVISTIRCVTRVSGIVSLIVLRLL